MVPAPAEQFRNELTACLALVVPVGMTEEGRREWLAVAWQTLKYLPPDLLAIGCAEARRTCDHPSKLVPAIVAATEESMNRRYRIERDRAQPALSGPKPKYVTADEAASILNEYGLGSTHAAGGRG